jgi:NAD-dependent SIR2 family protein deacetylase
VLHDDPDVFWGFWGQCFNDYRGTAPHEGYEIIARWVEERFRNSAVDTSMRQELKLMQPSGYDWKPDELEPYQVTENAEAFYVITSNVDAHFYDWFPACEIYECHGSVELFQCARPKSSACPGIWRAPYDGFRFRVDKHAIRAPVGNPDTLSKDSLQDLNFEATRCVGNVRLDKRSRALKFMPQSTSRLATSSFTSNHPVCPFCQGAARPAVLMFDDADWQDVKSQLQRKQHWVHALLNIASLAPLSGSPLKVAILEIGAGGNVTTVRNSSEQILRGCLSAGATANLIRINPELPIGDEDDFAPGGKYESHVISIMAGALESLCQIDASMEGRVSIKEGSQLLELGKNA